MVLKDVHDSLDEIPEQYRELYTEKNGKYECTGITGFRTSADFQRISGALEQEKDAHKQTKTQLGEKLRGYEALGEFDDVRQKLERFPELEAAAGNKLDEAKIEEIVQRRVDGTLKSKTSPLEHKIATLTRERDEFKERDAQWSEKDRRRRIRGSIRKAALAAKLRPEAIEDAEEIGERLMQVGEDGSITTKDQVGVTPGIDPAQWLGEVQEKRPHWWPDSEGGGARGGKARGTFMGGKNPWSREHWSKTEQGNVLREHGREKAEQMAKAAGSELLAGRPPEPRK